MQPAVVSHARFGAHFRSGFLFTTGGVVQHLAGACIMGSSRRDLAKSQRLCFVYYSLCSFWRRPVRKTNLRWACGILRVVRYMMAISKVIAMVMLMMIVMVVVVRSMFVFSHHLFSVNSSRGSPNRPERVSMEHQAYRKILRTRHARMDTTTVASVWDYKDRSGVNCSTHTART